MTATLADSTAILKTLYPDGAVPRVVHKMYPSWDKLKKRTGFKGENCVVPLFTEDAQGSSADFATALGSLQQGTYNRFTVTRVEHFGVARIKGQALEAAVEDEGAMVDLWENETKSIANTEVKRHATYFFGNGSGALGDISSGQGGTTLTMSSTTNMNYFGRLMRVGAISANSLTATVRTGFARISSMDRRPGTRTITKTGNNWNTDINSLTSGDYLVVAGDAPTGGSTASVDMGLDQWVVGGASPGTLFSLSRDSDPVRLAGQQYDATGVDYADAVQEASALAGFQGVGYPDVLIANNRDLANWKKTLEAKRIYSDSQKSGSMGFSRLVIEGENGPIEVVSDPFCPINRAYLLKWDEFDHFSLGAAPHIKADDKNQWLRVANDDAIEVRFASYGNNRCKNPAPNVRILNFGA